MTLSEAREVIESLLGVIEGLCNDVDLEYAQPLLQYAERLLVTPVPPQNERLLAVAPALLQAAKAQLHAVESGMLMVRPGLVPSAYEKLSSNYDALYNAIAAAEGRVLA